MDLIIETDLGHDPDDFFAICYLVTAGVKIRCITIVPGDPDQIAVARLLCRELGIRDIPIGASKLGRTKYSSGGVHHDLLSKYKISKDGKPDGPGDELVESTLRAYPDCELFVIGPVTSIGKFLQRCPTVEIKRATMQGGFLSYDIYRPKQVIDKFEGLYHCPTFNLNGDRKGGVTFIETPQIKQRQFVGKNICHTVVYNKDVHEKVKRAGGETTFGAHSLFIEAMDMYLERHTEKKFHDPTAAVCHLHPEIATWVKGKIVKWEDGWATKPCEDGDLIIADIDYDKLWDHIA